MKNSTNAQNLSINTDMLNWDTDAFQQFESDTNSIINEIPIENFPSIDDESFSGELPWGYMKECHEYFGGRA